MRPQQFHLSFKPSCVNWRLAIVEQLTAMEPLEAVILPDVPSALRAIPNLPKLTAAYALDQHRLDLFLQTLTDDATQYQPPWRFDA